MIGQTELLQSMQESPPAPFTILVGAPHSGKKLVVRELGRMYGLPVVFCETGVDAIRQVIDTAYNFADEVVYCFPDAQTMSLGAKNALLKITEEPPKGVYFVLTADTTQSIPATLTSRARLMYMSNYTWSELSQFAQEMSLPSDSVQTLLEICSTPGEMQLVLQHDTQAFLSFVDTVIKAIASVNGANAFKIAERIQTKKDGEGYDMSMFLKVFISRCRHYFAESGWTEVKYSDAVIMTAPYLQQIQNPSINKAMTLDMWILDMRRVLK